MLCACVLVGAFVFVRVFLYVSVCCVCDLLCDGVWWFCVFRVCVYECVYSVCVFVSTVWRVVLWIVCCFVFFSMVVLVSC